MSLPQQGQLTPDQFPPGWKNSVVFRNLAQISVAVGTKDASSEVADFAASCVGCQTGSVGMNCNQLSDIARQLVQRNKRPCMGLTNGVPFATDSAQAFFTR